MKKSSRKDIIQFLIFICFGIALFLVVYRNYDFRTLFAEFSKFNYWLFIPAIIIFILSHVFRARRWQFLLEDEINRPSFKNTFLAVLNAYFANMALPRLGEVTRCAIVSKYENKDFSKVLGTVVTERCLDFICVIILTIIAFVSQSGVFCDFIQLNPNVKEFFVGLLKPKSLIILVLIGIAFITVFVIIAKGKLNRFKICEKISVFFNNFWKGIITIVTAKHKFAIILHSFLIWTMYFLMLYVCFFAFEEFSHLGIAVALVLFVAGSFGMIIPSPNGMGSYHFMLIQTLVLYGVSNESAASFALISHGLQTLMIIALGVISMILVPVLNKNHNESESEECPEADD